MLNPKVHFETATAETRIVHAHDPNRSESPPVPLQNLSVLRTSMDYLQRFLSESIATRTLLTNHQMDTVSNEIGSTIHQIIINGATLLSFSHNSPAPGESVFPVSSKIPDSPDTVAPKNPRLKFEVLDEDINDGEDFEIIELDTMELLADHVRFYEVCGKGFKCDANLRMHMSVRGQQFKTSEALAKPRDDKFDGTGRRETQFSCPFEGCNRSKLCERFRPWKSILCARNHFKRTQCPKMYSCNICRKKKFAVLSDLKSHQKQCGESKWKCSCGTTFSRKDKLFGHVALFRRHVPALAVDDEGKGKQVMVAVEEEAEDRMMLTKDTEFGADCLDGLPVGLFDDLDGFGFGSNDQSVEYMNLGISQ